MNKKSVTSEMLPAGYRYAPRNSRFVSLFRGYTVEYTVSIRYTTSKSWVDEVDNIVSIKYVYLSNNETQSIDFTVLIIRKINIIRNIYVYFLDTILYSEERQHSVNTVTCLIAFCSFCNCRGRLTHSSM